MCDILLNHSLSFLPLKENGGGGGALRVKIPRDRLTTALTFMALHIQPSNLSHLASSSFK